MISDIEYGDVYGNNIAYEANINYEEDTKDFSERSEKHKKTKRIFKFELNEPDTMNTIKNNGEYERLETIPSLKQNLVIEKLKNSELKSRLEELERQNKKLSREISQLKQRRKNFSFKLPTFEEVMETIEFDEF